ncbi:hypothetical protein F5Y04DRAFT_251503 [Hypomontagnella monticulosa]|nr:hypothetical protein F5Y04DRAFT_251503 [Hypomontagnella monticulosa]
MQILILLSISLLGHSILILSVSLNVLLSPYTSLTTHQVYGATSSSFPGSSPFVYGIIPPGVASFPVPCFLII